MNLSDIFVAGAGASVTVLNDQTFNASGTWVKPTGIQYAPDDVALIELWGGGGGGVASVASTWVITGGRGGAYLRDVVPISSLAASQAVVVGAGGAGNAINYDFGSPGGDSTFAGLIAPGGVGGQRYDSGAVYDYGLNGYADAPPVTLYTPGAGGWATSSNTILKLGRKSIYGGNGGDGVASGDGANGQAPGGGGGTSRQAISAARGGSGATGRVRVRIVRGLNQWEIAGGPL